MLNEKRKPNKKFEFLLDIQPFVTGNNNLYIYDISDFLPANTCSRRDDYIRMIAHCITHDKFTVYIIDRHKVLSPTIAQTLVKDWLHGDKVTYRLD